MSRAGNGRFRGIRHAGGWDASPDVRNSHTNPPPGLYGEAAYREGVAQLGALGLTYEAWQYHPQLEEVIGAGARRAADAPWSSTTVGGPLGIGPYAGKTRRGVRDLESRHGGTGALPQRGGEAGRPGHGYRRVRLHSSGPRRRRRAELADAWKP